MYPVGIAVVYSVGLILFLQGQIKDIIIIKSAVASVELVAQNRRDMMKIW
jgi:hypothetical protein